MRAHWEELAGSIILVILAMWLMAWLGSPA